MAASLFKTRSPPGYAGNLGAPTALLDQSQPAMFFLISTPPLRSKDLRFSASESSLAVRSTLHVVYLLSPEGPQAAAEDVVAKPVTLHPVCVLVQVV